MGITVQGYLQGIGFDRFPQDIGFKPIQGRDILGRRVITVAPADIGDNPAGTSKTVLLERLKYFYFQGGSAEGGIIIISENNRDLFFVGTENGFSIKQKGERDENYKKRSYQYIAIGHIFAPGIRFTVEIRRNFPYKTDFVYNIINT